MKHTLFSVQKQPPSSLSLSTNNINTIIMSQQQPRRPQAAPEQEPLKYGDVFPSVAGSDLASKPIAPRDAAAMQAAECQILGHTLKGGPAAVMESAASVNEQAGLVGHGQATSAVADQGVNVTERVEGDTRLITESIGGQVVGQYVGPAPADMAKAGLKPGAVTIGQALEAATITAGDKPVDQKDAAAIQAAEIRATGTGGITPGGVAAAAQSAASLNDRTPADQDKTTLSDVLHNATARLPADKAVTRADAEGVIAAEVRNDPDMVTYPGGVASSVAAAAKCNQG